MGPGLFGGDMGIRTKESRSRTVSGSALSDVQLFGCHSHQHSLNLHGDCLLETLEYLLAQLMFI